MKLTAKIKLQPTSEQHEYLLDTIKMANQACNYISDVAWNTQVFGRHDIDMLVYYDIRNKFDLPAHITHRCIFKVTDAYKLTKKTKRTFDQFGAIPYDERMLTYWILTETLWVTRVSIWTTSGGQTMEFVAGSREIELIDTCWRGESDLAFIDGKFYLFATCDTDDPTPDDVTDVLAVDLFTEARGS